MQGAEGVGIQGVKSPNTLLFLDDVQLLGLQGVQGAGGVGIQDVKPPNTLIFLDDVQLLGLQGVQGAGGVGIQGVKSPNTTCTCSLHNCQESPWAAGVKVS
jgi:hypothetical protein